RRQQRTRYATQDSLNQVRGETRGKTFFFFFLEFGLVASRLSTANAAGITNHERRIEQLEQEREGQMAIVNPSQLVAQHPFPEVYLSCPDEREAQAVLRVAWRLRRAPLSLTTFLSSNFFKKLVGVLLKERLLILNANAF